MNMMASRTADQPGRAIGAFCAALMSAFLFTSCDGPPANQRQGYIEGEFVYISSPFAGTLEGLSVQRGAQVKAGELLFVLSAMPEAAAREEAERRLNEARATLEDVRKGARPSEIASLAAQSEQAQAALQFSQKELARQEQLMRTPGATSEQEMARARATWEQDKQKVAQLTAELKTGQLGARPDQVKAAEANVRARTAELAQAEWDLAQKSQSAPQAATVFDTLYSEGEWVTAGRPIVTLLPPEKVKLRVFVPETWLGALHVGDLLQVHVDGVGDPFTGKVSFISPEAEFTPPVVYTTENRAKFVYLVEAVFEPTVAVQLHPGQPVDVQFNSIPRRE